MTKTKERYFYTKNYPHQWSTGPIIIRLDDGPEWKYIESLERAKELAEKHKVDGHNQNHCDTTYGIEYIDD